MPQTLMHAKLHKLQFDDSLVARPNLVQLIRAGAREGVTLIVAPAGYDKTTLVTQWAAEAELPVAWFAIDESDNDLVRFLSYLAAAIQAIFLDACPHLLGLLVRSPLPDVERLAATLSNDIDALPQRIALVLDDYHWITEPDIQCVLNEFLRHPVRKLHLVLTSRSQPALALSRLRSSRHMCELQMQDLRLTETDAAALLAQRPPWPCQVSTAGVPSSARRASTGCWREDGDLSSKKSLVVPLACGSFRRYCGGYSRVIRKKSGIEKEH